VATFQVIRCDVCGTEDQVAAVTVVAEFKAARPWEVDMCQRCYESRFGDLVAKSRRAGRSMVRPQHRMVKTEITEANL
jgi:hypothetical protein